MNPKNNARGTALRVEGALLAAIDQYKSFLEEEMGVRVTRTAAAEALLRMGIRFAERTPGGKKIR